MSAHIDAFVEYAPRCCFAAAVKSGADRSHQEYNAMQTAVANIRIRSYEKQLGPIDMCLNLEGNFMVAVVLKHVTLLCSKRCSMLTVFQQVHCTNPEAQVTGDKT